MLQNFSVRISLNTKVLNVLNIILLKTFSTHFPRPSRCIIEKIIFVSLHHRKKKFVSLLKDNRNLQLEKKS